MHIPACYSKQTAYSNYQRDFTKQGRFSPKTWTNSSWTLMLLPRIWERLQWVFSLLFLCLIWSPTPLSLLENFTDVLNTTPRFFLHQWLIQNLVKRSACRRSLLRVQRLVSTPRALLDLYGSLLIYASDCLMDILIYSNWLLDIFDTGSRCLWDVFEEIWENANHELNYLPARQWCICERSQNSRSLLLLFRERSEWYPPLLYLNERINLPR